MLRPPERRVSCRMRALNAFSGFAATVRLTVPPGPALKAKPRNLRPKAGVTALFVSLIVRRSRP